MKDECTVCTTFYQKKGMPEPVLLRSARHHGITVQPFGTKRKFAGFVATKLKPLRGFLDGVKTPLAMFLDGNDAFFTVGLQPLLAEYRSIADGEVLIGCESSLWPHQFLREKLDALAAKAKLPGPFKYIDTGLILGPTEKIKAVLDTIFATFPHYEATLKLSDKPVRQKRLLDDDVGLWSLNLCDGHITSVLDYGCRVIAAMHNMVAEQWSVSDGRLLLKPTASRPCIVHCNGHRRRDRRMLEATFGAVYGKSAEATLTVSDTGKGWHKP